MIERQGIIIKIDEYKFCCSKYNRGHIVDSLWELKIVEKISCREIYDSSS